MMDRLAFVYSFVYIDSDMAITKTKQLRVFTKRHLQEALKKHGLPSSYSTVLKYEEMGVIPKPAQVISYGKGKEYRSYMQEEIDEIVRLVKAYKAG